MGGGLPGIRVGIWAPSVLGGGGGGSGAVVDNGSGVYSGFTDFSEFDEGAGLPDGISAYDNGTFSYAIASDEAEGNYFQVSYTPLANIVPGVAWEIDSLNLGAYLSEWPNFEVLGRVWVPAFSATNRKSIGPMCNISGPFNNAAFAMAGAVEFYRTGSDFEVGTKQAMGASQSLITADFSETEATGVWSWIRTRHLWEADVAGRSSVYSKWWYGDIGDEPGAWDYESPGTAAFTNQDINAFGVGLGAEGLLDATPAHRIAYISFTTDPDTVSPPTP